MSHCRESGWCGWETSARVAPCAMSATRTFRACISSRAPAPRQQIRHPTGHGPTEIFVAFRSAAGRWVRSRFRPRPCGVEDITKDAQWIARPDWAAREGILGFGGQPLSYHGEILGVLGVFTRATFCGEALSSLRMIADHAAAAIANARAFEEIRDLQSRLAIENEYLRGENKRGSCFRGDSRRGPVDSTDRGANRTGRANRRLGTDLGRIRYRQGARRARDSSTQQSRRTGR